MIDSPHQTRCLSIGISHYYLLSARDKNDDGESKGYSVLYNNNNNKRRERRKKNSLVGLGEQLCVWLFVLYEGVEFLSRR